MKHTHVSRIATPAIALAFAGFLALSAGSAYAQQSPSTAPAPAATAPADQDQLELPPGVTSLDQLSPKQQQQVISWNKAKKENFCNALLDAEAATVYDEEGLKKLLAVKRECPVGVSLNETLKYVDTTLVKSFDDPYTLVLPPDDAKSMQEELAGTKKAFKGGGIGAVISMDPSKTMPISPEALAKAEAEAKAAVKDDPSAGLLAPPPSSEGDKPAESNDKAGSKAVPTQLVFTGLVNHAVAGGPAAKAGLRDGDIILKADGVDLIGQPAQHVVEDVLRGPLASKVKLTVQRGKKVFDITITRGAVVPDAVWSRDLGHGIYSIVVTGFHEQTSMQIANEMERLNKKARGFVIDVRNNPGGLLDQAILAAAWFVHDGVIVSQRERIQGDPEHPRYLKITWTRKGDNVINETVDESTGKVLDNHSIKLTTYEVDPKTHKPIHQVTTDKIPFFATKPTVVLANGGSASAAEIFTGAVSENWSEGHNRQGAKFIGVHTFGKFIGQSVLNGPMGTMIKATSFRYFSPKGEWLGDAYKHRTGLTPQQEVKQPENGVPYTATDVQLNAAVDFLLHGDKTNKAGAQHPSK